MNQIHESQKLRQQQSLQMSNKQLLGPQLYNLNKHTSFVFAITLHNIVLEESFEKCDEFNDQKQQNMNEIEWLQLKKRLWEGKLQSKGGEILKQQKCFIVSAGADKNIYLWDIDNIQKSNSQVQIKPEQLPQYQNPNRQDNQGDENQNNLNFSKDELDLHHVIIPYQQNLYEFVTCLLSVELNQNQSYLIVGYENNQIIRYKISGQYWQKVKQIRYVLNLSNVSEITKKLHHHNDAVRSMVYFNDQLCSCGDDMQLLIQNIEGVVIKRFFFDSIIENLYIWNHHLIFPHYTVNLMPTSYKEEELIYTQNIAQQIAEQNEQNQNIPIQQEAGAVQQVQRRQTVDKHTYTYGLQQCLMIMGQDQKNNLDIQLNAFNYYRSLEEAYNEVDKITCFELSDNQNILYSTESGKLIKIKEPLKIDEKKKKEIQKDYYKDQKDEKQEYEYQIQNCSKIQQHNLNQIIMSFIKYDSKLYLFCKNKKTPEQVVLQIGQDIISEDQFYQVVENNPLRIQYLQQYVKQKVDQKDQQEQIPIIKPYEVFLQNPLLVKEGDTKIILLCGDQLRYYSFNRLSDQTL